MPLDDLDIDFQALANPALDAIKNSIDRLKEAPGFPWVSGEADAGALEACIRVFIKNLKGIIVQQSCAANGGQSLEIDSGDAQSKLTITKYAACICHAISTSSPFVVKKENGEIDLNETFLANIYIGIQVSIDAILYFRTMEKYKDDANIDINIGNPCPDCVAGACIERYVEYLFKYNDGYHLKFLRHAISVGQANPDMLTIMFDHLIFASCLEARIGNKLGRCEV